MDYGLFNGEIKHLGMAPVVPPKDLELARLGAWTASKLRAQDGLEEPSVSSGSSSSSSLSIPESGSPSAALLV